MDWVNFVVWTIQHFLPLAQPGWKCGCLWPISDLPSGFSTYFCSLSYLLSLLSCIFPRSFSSPDGLSFRVLISLYFFTSWLYLLVIFPWFRVMCSSLWPLTKASFIWRQTESLRELILKHQLLAAASVVAITCKNAKCRHHFFFFFMEKNNCHVLSCPSLLSTYIVRIVRCSQQARCWHHSGHQCWELPTNHAAVTASLAWWQSVQSNQGMLSTWQLHLLSNSAS